MSQRRIRVGAFSRLLACAVVVSGSTALVCLAPISARGASVVGAEGALDTSFAEGGRLLDWRAVDSDGISVPADAVVQPDGKIVVALSNSDPRYMGVTRYTAAGGLDPTFGFGGRVDISYNFGSIGYADAAAVALAPDGKIVVAGTYETGSERDLAVARLTASGALDPTFAGDGTVTLDIGDTDDAYDVVVQPNGAVVVAGRSDVNAVMARFTSAGALDSTFGSGGVALSNVNESTVFTALALGAGGTLVAVGDEFAGGFSGIVVSRWTATGQPDVDFNGGYTIDLISNATHAHAKAVAVQKDGKVVVGGSAPYIHSDTADTMDKVVTRYTAAGQIDYTFGVTYPTNFGDRAAWIDNHGEDETVSGVAVQPDGKIVVLGSEALYTGLSSNFTLDRLTPAGVAVRLTGQSDHWTDFGFRDDDAVTVALQRNGRIVAVGGSADSDSNIYPAVARYFGDGTPPSAPSLSSLARWSMGSSVKLAWSKATDDNTGVRSYTVDGRVSLYDAAAAGPVGAVRSGLTVRSWPAPRQAGRTTCFAVAARDYAGNTGVPGNERCTAWPVDDRTFAAHGSWATGKGSAYYLRTFRRSTSAGASVRGKVAFRHLALVATTCPTCGAVKVYLGKTLLVKKSLHSSRTHNRVIIAIASSGSVRKGTLRVVQASNGKPVTIDGVGVNLF